MDLQTFIVVTVVKIAVVIGALLTADAYIVLLERKLVARIQNRWGPNRTGPFGLLQPLADGIKLILKEDMVPDNVNKALYVLAPILTLAVALMTIAVIPFGESITVFGVTTPLQITDINIALLFVLGITSISVYGIALAGWSSNSKYALLGALRASAQMISYELSLGLSLVGVVIMAQSLSLRDIVNAQAGGFWHWNIFGLGAAQFPQVVGFFIYLTAAFAESNRSPFDLPEAETELVAGYHTEYSAMKFAMFFVAEYAAMITVGCLATILFLGGWHGPVFGPPLVQSLLPVLWFVLKVFCFIFLYIWIRGTLPRFRYDQLMAFGWKFLLPLAVLNVIVTAAVVLLRS
jgi:NADH-quinone oxidoreductase subunit H